MILLLLAYFASICGKNALIFLILMAVWQRYLKLKHHSSAQRHHVKHLAFMVKSSTSPTYKID